MYLTFKLAKNKGDLSLEPHLNSPQDSQIFVKFPTFFKRLFSC